MSNRTGFSKELRGKKKKKQKLKLLGLRPIIW
jgi:hypothetical protein